MARLRILFVTPYVPSRLRTRPFHLLRGLAERGHRVDLFAAATTAAELGDAAALRPSCGRLEVVRISTGRSLWSCLRGLGGGAPLQARYCVAPAMTTRLHAAAADPGAYDILHVEHLRAALYGLASPLRPRVYDAVDCMSELLAQTAARGSTWQSRATARLEVARTRRFERAAVEGFDRVLVTTEAERRALLALVERAGGPAEDSLRVHALPNGVDTEYFAPTAAPRDPATIVFVGRLAYHANLGAARTLLADIMPRIWARRPDARLCLVGANPPAALRARAARARGAVEVTGYVADLRPYLARATVSVSPLPYAVGIQNKVLEAMAMATPVVASPAACVALGAVAGEDVLVEATPEGCAAQVLRLLDDPEVARRVGEAGRRYVSMHHDWRRTVGRLEEIYREAIAAHTVMAAPVREVRA